MWRLWTFGCALPLGLLAALAGGGAAPSAVRLGGAALAAGVLATAAASAIARRADDDPARGAHLAVASSVGLAALPALGTALLGLSPGPAVWCAVVVLALAGAGFRAARQRGPSGGARRLVLRAVSVLAGASAGVGLASLLAAGPSRMPAFSEARAAAILDTDATVATRPLPVCAARPAGARVLLERGARPRLSPDADALWFDADVAGRRQVHRLERATGAVACWTCGEPGNNWRPFPGERRVVFETDRHATWRDPVNTEIHVAAASRPEQAPPRHASRRLTYARGPDDHAILAPGSGTLVWSRREGSTLRVVAASVQRGHGGILLGRPSELVRGGARWVAPAGWSPDARSFVVVRGNPFAPLDAVGIDLAGDRRAVLAHDAVPAAASWNGDGGRVARAGTRRAHLAGLLPDVLGPLLGAWATAVTRDAAVRRGTALRLGEPWDEGAALDLGDVGDLGDVARWGAPTGVALIPDASAVVLGQRRPGGRERLLEIDLDCGV